MKLSYYAASYGPRYGDPAGTLVALDRGQIAGVTVSRKVEAATEEAAIWEAIALDEAFGEDDGEASSIVVYPGGCFSKADSLFSAAELREHRAALRRGEVVHLSR